MRIIILLLSLFFGFLAIQLAAKNSLSTRQRGNPTSSIRNENRKTVNPVGPTRTAVKNTSKTPSIRRPAQPIRSKKKISDKGKKPQRNSKKPKKPKKTKRTKKTKKPKKIRKKKKVSRKRSQKKPIKKNETLQNENQSSSATTTRTATTTRMTTTPRTRHIRDPAKDLQTFGNSHSIKDSDFNNYISQNLNKNTEEILKLRNSNTITKNNLLKESDVTEIWQQDENGNFKNLDFKGYGWGRDGKKLSIYSTKNEYPYLFANYDTNRVTKPPNDKFMVSITSDDGANHHMIGNERNTDEVVRRLINGDYVNRN